MFCRKFSSFAQLGARLLPKVVERKDVLKIVSILKRYPRYFASECITPTALRLWSDSGREHLPSNPFDDLGAWHRAEARSFLYNVTVDDVGTSSYIGLRETNEDDFKVIELEPDLYYFAVFDGHGGSASVEFVREHLHECVKHFYSYDKNMENVLINAFLKCNSDLEEYCLFLTERGKLKLRISSQMINGSISPKGETRGLSVYEHFILLSGCQWWWIVVCSLFHFFLFPTKPQELVNLIGSLSTRVFETGTATERVRVPGQWCLPHFYTNHL